MLHSRVLKAGRLIAELDLDALIFTGLPNIRYLAGFTGSDGVLVVARDDAWFLTDSRYTTQAGQEASHCRVREYRTKVEGVAALCAEASLVRVGIEAEQTTVAFFRALSDALSGVELVPLETELNGLRLVKEPAELELLSTCAAIASAALEEILPLVRPGAVEQELALALEMAMRRRGADDRSFDFIVASGERGALPHGRASEKVVADGELVTFDFGARYRGYCSDETVTVAVGGVDDRQREIYQVVKEAHDLAIAAVRPGIACRDLDRIARGYIEEKGFGPYFGHGLGHGVGIEVHEKPVVSYRSEQLAEEGMVFTIEPGIYIPGFGGVRIEDTVVVTGNGCRLLTGVSKELRIV